MEGYKLRDDKEAMKSIDIVWKNIIENPQFPILSKFLKGSLSIFHSTATVEGAINTTRNILGERSHRLKDENLCAKKLIKSGVKVAKSKCCFDYDVGDPVYMKNWHNASKNVTKSVIEKDEKEEHEIMRKNEGSDEEKGKNIEEQMNTDEENKGRENIDEDKNTEEENRGRKEDKSKEGKRSQRRIFDYFQ